MLFFFLFPTGPHGDEMGKRRMAQGRQVNVGENEGAEAASYDEVNAVDQFQPAKHQHGRMQGAEVKLV